MNADSNYPHPAEIGAKIQQTIASLPSAIWSTTTPPTYFKIAHQKVSLVPSNYQGQTGELVFCYRNDDGYISIQQVFPANSAE